VPGEQRGEQVAALGQRRAVPVRPAGVNGGQELGSDGLTDH